MFMNVGERAEVIAAACDALTRGQVGETADIIQACYPFIETERANLFIRRPKRIRLAANEPINKRKVVVDFHKYTHTFLRDGFIDRYTGDRLVFPPVLRVISLELMREFPLNNPFPYHDNWKYGCCHKAFWELSATIDHVIPATRGGADEPSNWLTTSMAQNLHKGKWKMEELGWAIHEPGDCREWDGLLYWFLQYTERRSDVLVDWALKAWHKAAVSCRDRI